MVKDQRDWTGLIIAGTWIAFLLICLLAVASCQTFKYENVDTVRKGIVVANAEIKAANLLLQDLIKRQVISQDKATDALNALQAALDELKNAHEIIKISGDPFEAQAGVERADAALTLAITLLSAYVEID